MDNYKFASNPVAFPGAIVAGNQFRFTLLSDVVFRYEWAEDGHFQDRASTFAINRSFPPPKYTVDETSDSLVIRTANFLISYDKTRFSPQGLVVSFTGKVTLWGADWHYGDSPKGNLGGTARTLDEVNGRCDMGAGILSREGYSTVDDSSSMLFTDDGFVSPRPPGDRVDGYMFCYGRDIKAAMKAFYAISGAQPSLPRWALGNWWSRYYAYSADEYIALMDKFKSLQVPLSVAVIDMDWHQVQGDHIPHAGWTGYSWNRDLFPDPKAFGDALHERNLKITLNDHPHAGVHHHEDSYQRMADVLGHDTSTKAPLLFDPTSPSYMHAWLNTLHRKLEEEACDFWWIDWQQGPISRVPGLDPLWLLNHFHFLDHELQNKRGNALIFSRYAGPGSHRYPVGFSGDSITTWESLAFQPEFTATAANIGYGWWSHDIGGHMGGYRDDELAARWLQFGCFSPILRLHSANSAWASKEPDTFRPEFGQVMIQFMQLRHRLVPYIYTEGLVRGGESPLLRPMYWDFPEREEAYEKPNQYLFGSQLVVAPIVSPRNPKTNHAAVDVWVPPGRHVDIFTGLVYDGDRIVRLYRALEQIPVLAQQGSILPLDAAPVPENGCKNPLAYELIVVVGKDAEYTIVEDSADDDVSQSQAVPASASSDASTPTRYRNIRIKYEHALGRLTVPASGKRWKFTFVSVTPHTVESLEVVVDGTPSTYTATVVDKHPVRPGLVVEPSQDIATDATITVDLGPEPQLHVLDVLPRIKSFVLDAQLDFALKDKIWAIVTSNKPKTSRLGNLMALNLEQDVVGVILELLLADSR